MRARMLAAAALAGAVAAAPSLTVDVTATSHLAPVVATISGLTKAQATDAWVGVFYPSNASVSAIAPLPYPATAPWTENAPAKWLMLSDVPGCGTGSCNYTFQLVNTFTDARLVLFTGGINTPVAVASSEPITFSDVNAPMRGHLARTQDPTEMRVVWNAAHDDDNPLVKWGTASGVYTGQAPAEPNTYFKEDMCGDVAAGQGWFWSHYWLYAVMTGLTPGQLIYYTYGSDANGWAPEQSFRAAPLPGAEQELNVVVVADMGVTEADNCTNHWDEPDAGRSMARMRSFVQRQERDYTLALHVGDLAYGTGYQIKWAAFMSALAGVYDSVPYMIGQGNHERDYPGTSTAYETSVDSGGECGVSTQVRFPSPTGTSHMQDEGFYSFTHGPLFVVMINTELAWAPGSQQYAFIQQALASVNRSVTPWVAVAGHRPMYWVDATSPYGHLDEGYHALEPLLVQYEVDLYIVGHVHNTFVSCPVINGTCVTPSTPGGYDGPIHVCIGNAGQGITPINPSAVIPWSRFAAMRYGSSTLNIAGPTQLSMTMYDDETGGVLYNFTINRAWPRL